MLSPACALIEQLAEHLDAGDHRLGGVADADDLHFVADLDDAALDAAGDHRAAAGDREHVLDRHQERLVDRTLRLRDVGVDRLHQLEDRIVAELLVVAAFQRQKGRAADHRGVVARKLVLREQLAHFQLDQVEQLRIVDHVALVEVDDERRHADLAGEQDVLAGLRHRAVGGRHHQDGAVHLRRAGDHVLDVVGVAGTVDVGVVPVRGLVLDVRRVDRDAPRLFLRRRVDRGVVLERRTAGFGQHLGDRRRQRRLAVIDVADRADVAVRLGPFEFLFGHRGSPSFSKSFVVEVGAIRRTSPGPPAPLPAVPAGSDRTAWCTAPGPGSST